MYRELVPIEAVFGEVGLGGVPQSVGDVEIVNRRPTSTAPLPGGQAAGAESAAGTTASQAPTSAIPTFAQYVRWLEGSGLHYSIPGETPATPGGAATPETAAAGTTTPDPAQDQAAAITPGQPYTVRKGDSLWLIARRAYGDATQWRKIYDANAQQLPSAADLRPGIVLQIP